MSTYLSVLNRDSENGLSLLTEGRLKEGNPAGELFFSVFATLAQFERDLIRERTQAGLAAAREKGRIGLVVRLFPKVIKKFNLLRR
jgi:DNA invertase Pin-like site-specific DNA recombinase